MLLIGSFLHDILLFWQLMDDQILLIDLFTSNQQCMQFFSF